MLDRLARFVTHHRLLVLGGWIALTLFGAYSAKQVSGRWLEQFSIPGHSAYEANQRVLHTFGNGAQAPSVAVFTSDGDVTKAQKISTVCCGWSSRGVALGDGKVYLGRLDGKLVALDQETGKLDWSTQVARWQDGYTITAAPLYYDGGKLAGTPPFDASGGN